MAVYLIHAGETERVKIGKADNPVARLGQLQTGNPERLRLIRIWQGGEQEETALQALFEPYRVIGDWFIFAPAMLDGGGLIELWREGVALDAAMFAESARLKAPMKLDEASKIIEGARFPRRQVVVVMPPHNQDSQIMEQEDRRYGCYNVRQIVRELGGTRALAQVLNIDYWTVFRWETGAGIPPKYWPAIFRYVLMIKECRITQARLNEQWSDGYGAKDHDDTFIATSSESSCVITQGNVSR